MLMADTTELWLLCDLYYKVVLGGRWDKWFDLSFTPVQGQMQHGFIVFVWICSHNTVFWQLCSFENKRLF